MKFPTSCRVPALFCILALAVLGGGCGDKITIPEPVGFYSINAYYMNATYEDAFARELAIANGLLYVVGSDGSLVKRSQNYEERERQQGLDDPTALCVDDDNGLIFVWEDGASRLSTYAAGDLTYLHATDLPAVQRGARIVTSRRGVEAVDPAIHTFVYIADPDSGIVHRYAYYEGDGVVLPMGILCRSGGLSVRFVNEPTGMARDDEGHLWICDADTNRNWVIRFDPTPDLTDVSGVPEIQDPWRGLAIVIEGATCEPPAAADYTLGDAPECNEAWTGGPSDVAGEFHSPQALSTDGLGRIYVADHPNNRIQIFTADGVFDLLFGNEEKSPAPLSICAVDKVVGGDDVNFGAYVFLVSETSGLVHKFISHEEYTESTQQPPPEE